MTSYLPATALPVPPLPPGPKLAYEVGEMCWIHTGVRDKAGNPKLIASKVVYWFDLPDLAQRFYIIRVLDRDFLHFFVRDVTVMASEPDGLFPYQRTRHDDNSKDGPPKAIDWRNS